MGFLGQGHTLASIFERKDSRVLKHKKKKCFMIKCQNPVMHQIIYGILYIIIMGSGIAHDY